MYFFFLSFQLDLEPEGKVFVVITLTGSFTEGKNEFWMVSGICVSWFIFNLYVICMHEFFVLFIFLLLFYIPHMSESIQFLSFFHRTYST